VGEAKALDANRRAPDREKEKDESTVGAELYQDAQH
jgi:hypothetical protein